MSHPSQNQQGQSYPPSQSTPGYPGHPSGVPYGQMDPRQAAAYHHASGAPPHNAPGMYQQPGHSQLQYISTPPAAVPGQFPNPNPPPFTTAPRTSSTSSPQPVRFPCTICGATFTRQHDRKRHHETLHLEHPPVHRCEYCLKEFARGDSLKRHVDGGCDKMQTGSSRR